MISHWGLVAVAVALVPTGATKAGAAEACSAWTAEMLDDEGGQVLTAHTCSEDDAVAYLSLRCFDGKVLVENDLAVGMDVTYDPMQEVPVPVEFVTDEGSAEISLLFSEMTAMFAGETPAEGPLVDLLTSGARVEIRDPAGVYPARTYSLAGSSKAIGALLEGCK